jgi:hypothetical protein
LHAELEEAVGAGAASFRGLCEETRGDPSVAGNSDPFQVKKAELDLGIDVARGGGSLNFGDGAFGRNA